MSKTFVLNINNLHSTDDALKIRTYFLDHPGIEKVDIEMELNIVSLRYNESVGSPYKLLEAFTTLGYPVR